MTSTEKLKSYLLNCRNLFDLCVTFFSIVVVGFRIRFFGAKISVGFFPRDRDRYIKLFPTKRKKSWRFRRLSPRIISLLRVISPVETVISADYLDPCRDELATALFGFNFKVFVWNDELEVLKVQEETGIDSLDCIGFFSCTSKSFDSNLRFEVLELMPDKNFNFTESNPTICFAGQVDTQKYDSVILASQKLRKISDRLDQEILQTSPTLLFDLYSNKDFEVSIEEFVMLRHKAINNWRYGLLRNLSNEFKTSLVLFGKDFIRNDDFKYSDVRNDSAEFPQEYAKHRVNLELGSQCGDEYLYPRSLEIYSVNPGSLFVFERGNSSPRLPATYWKNFEELVLQINKVGIWA